MLATEHSEAPSSRPPHAPSSLRKREGIKNQSLAESQGNNTMEFIEKLIRGDDDKQPAGTSLKMSGEFHLPEYEGIQTSLMKKTNTSQASLNNTSFNLDKLNAERDSRLHEMQEEVDQLISKNRMLPGPSAASNYSAKQRGPRTDLESIDNLLADILRHDEKPPAASLGGPSPPKPYSQASMDNNPVLKQISELRYDSNGELQVEKKQRANLEKYMSPTLPGIAEDDREQSHTFQQADFLKMMEKAPQRPYNFDFSERDAGESKISMRTKSDLEFTGLQSIRTNDFRLE